MFREKSKATINSCPLKNIKSVDPTMFPQCKVILEQQTLNVPGSSLIFTRQQLRQTQNLTILLLILEGN